MGHCVLSFKVHPLTVTSHIAFSLMCPGSAWVSFFLPVPEIFETFDLYTLWGLLWCRSTQSD